MDAAQKLSTRLSLLLLIALTLSAPAWAYDTPQFSLSSNTVTCVGTSCPPGSVSVGSTGDQITYTVSAPDYSNDTGSNGAWLRISPTGAGQTTPGTIQFSLGTSSGLSQGSHTAVVHLNASAPAGVNPVNITVTFNQGSTGGSGTLSSNPSTLNLSAAQGAASFANPQITTTSAAPITISVTTSTSSCTNVSWLSASAPGTPISSTSPVNLFVQANASGLAPGLCTGSVIVSPSVGTVLTIPVNFTVGNGGTGNLTASPNPVNLTYTTGGNFPSTSLFLSSTSGIANVNAQVNCAQGWLLINGSTASSFPTSSIPTISAGATAPNLPTNNYTCSILLSDAGNSGTTYNVTVNLSVNGGSTTGLTVSPNPIVFNSQFNGSQLSTTVTVTSQQAGVLAINGNGCPWLTFNGNGFSINAGGSANFNVFANPFGLAVNTYSCTLSVGVGTLSSGVPVTLNVGTGSGGGATNVAPATVSLVYQAGASPSFASAPTLSITGPDGPWTTAVTYNSGTGWLVLSPSGGNLPTDRLLTLRANISGLAQGNYSATLTITTNGGGTANVNVNLAVVGNAIIYANPGSANFFYSGGSAPSPQAVFLANSDNSLVNATAVAADSWVIVQQNPGSASFSVTVDPTNKAAGVYTSSVNISEASAANNPYSFPVVLVVNNGGTGGVLSFFPSSLSFSTTNASVQTQSLTVSASAATTFTVSPSSTGNWLTVTPNSGTTNQALTVTANPAGLTNGTYNGSLNFSSNGTTQTVNVTFSVSGSTVGTGVSVACVTSCGTTQPSMAFTGQAGSGALPLGSLNVTSASGSTSVPFTATVTTSSGSNWLSTSIGSNVVNTPFNPLNVTVNVGTGSTALGAGTYNGNIAITPQGGGATVNVPVTLTVTAPPTVSASPATLSFTYRVGDPNPASQTVNVTGGTGLPFGVTVSPSGAWLAATPASGTTPGTVTVSINPNGLAAGNYTGTVTVAGTGSATGSTGVTVTLTVTAPLPTISRVVNAASYLGSSISPGELITVFASDANHPIGPSTPMGLQLDSTGKVATTLGGVQVLVNGLACPLTYVSSTQVNAVVPYEVALFLTGNVLVKYLGQSSNGVPVNIVTTAPGIYTLNSSGTGPAAALNSNNSVNAPNNPAARGDVVVLYLTGEGQTSPAGVTGKVTVANATPPYTPAPLLPIGITIGGQAANYIFAGEAPGIVSGVLQLNVVIPTTISAGDVPLVVSIGGNPSQAGVTVSVK
jgi:uncharacterized protein (TIGR03437 family)